MPIGTRLPPNASPNEKATAAVLQVVEAQGHGGIAKTQARVLVNRAQMVRLAAEGVGPTRAAELLGMNTEYVRRIYREEAFRKAVWARVNGAFEEVDEGVEARNKSVHEQIRDSAEEAFLTLLGMLRDPALNSANRIKIAQDFLNRVPETQAGQIITHKKFESEELALAARAAREMDEHSEKKTA